MVSAVTFCKEVSGSGAPSLSDTRPTGAANEEETFHARRCALDPYATTISHHLG